MKVGRGGYIRDMLQIVLYYEAGFKKKKKLPGDSNSLAVSFLKLGREKAR